MKQHGYVYRVTNRITGAVYVGQRRGEFRSWYLGSGTVIRNAVKKYGATNFLLEFIQSAFDQPSLDRLETHFISEARSRGETYNIRDGGLGSLFNGFGPMKGRTHSEDTKKRFSEDRKGSKNPNFGRDFFGSNNPHFGKRHSEEAKQKISARTTGVSRNKGVKRTPEQIEAMRQRALLQKPWEQHRGKKLSVERRKQISDHMKKRFAEGFKCAFTPETRRKISEGRKQYWARVKAEALI